MSATAPKPTDPDGIIREHIEHHPDLRPLGVCLHGPGPQPCPLCRAGAPIHPTPASDPPEPRRTTTPAFLSDDVKRRGLLNMIYEREPSLSREMAQLSTDCLARVAGYIDAAYRRPARSSAEEGTTTGEAMVNGFWRKMDALTSPAASPPEGAAGEPLTIILAKREAHADCLVITQVCDRDEAERRAERFYPLPSEPRVA